MEEKPHHKAKPANLTEHKRLQNTGLDVRGLSLPSGISEILETRTTEPTGEEEPTTELVISDSALDNTSPVQRLGILTNLQANLIQKYNIVVESHAEDGSNEEWGAKIAKQVKEIDDFINGIGSSQANLTREGLDRLNSLIKGAFPYVSDLQLPAGESLDRGTGSTQVMPTLVMPKTETTPSPESRTPVKRLSRIKEHLGNIAGKLTKAIAGPLAERRRIHGERLMDREERRRERDNLDIIESMVGICLDESSGQVYDDPENILTLLNTMTGLGMDNERAIGWLEGMSGKININVRLGLESKGMIEDFISILKSSTGSGQPPRKPNLRVV